MLNYGIGNSNAFMKKKNTHCYGNRNNHTVMRFAWMHGYDTGLSLRAEYEKIGKVVCVSKFNADRLRVDVGDAFDIDYAYNLLNDDEIRNKGEQPISVEPNKQMQFVSVGRMSPEKGYIRLIDICKQLENDGYKFNLWLVGDGPQREELEVHEKQIKADSCVTFLGQQSNPHAFTSKSDVFICPSFDEGYSTACTEAIMLGVPVITTDVSGGQEIIDEAECGLIVNKTNDDALYQALKKVLDKPETVSGWKRTLEATRERFSYKHRAKKLYKVLGLE